MGIGEVSAGGKNAGKRPSIPFYGSGEVDQFDATLLFLSSIRCLCLKEMDLAGFIPGHQPNLLPRKRMRFPRKQEEIEVRYSFG